MSDSGLLDPFQLAIVLDLRQRVADAEAAFAAAADPQSREEARRQVILWRGSLEDAANRVLHQGCVEA